MSPFRDAAYSCWKRFLGNKECMIMQLPEEIIVDEIFQYLTVYDIMRLRRVCKPLSVMTKKPAVWKRLLPHLSQIEQPLAPLPPSKAYNMRNLTAHDMELVVARALSYDAAWKTKVVRPFAHFGGLAFRKTNDMCLLPGGHFLVTSNEYFDPEIGELHYIHLWCLQHPATHRPAVIAYRSTEQPPYGLTAKYMTINGEKGISVGFLRKKNKDAKDKRKVPRNFELGGKMDQEDPFQPLKYECTVLHMPMHIVDALNDRHIPPQTSLFQDRVEMLKRTLRGDIWKVVGRIRTASQLGSMSLDRINDRPYVCLLKRPNTIAFQCLEDNVRSTLECRPVGGYFTIPHVIYNFRVVPDQNQVVVVRNIEKSELLEMKNSHTSLELYNLPPPGESVQYECADSKILDDEDYINVQISETYRKMPTHEDDSITPYLSQDHIQPISIYLRTELSMIHYAMYPYSVDPPPSPPDTPSSKEKATRDIKPPKRKFIYDLHRSVNLDFEIDDILEGRGLDMEDFETDEEFLAAERSEWTFPVKPRRDDHLRFLPGSSRGVFFQIPRRWGSIDPPVTAVFAYQISERDRGFFDYVAHMPMSDAVLYGDLVGIHDEIIETLEDPEEKAEKEEELEVLKALAPEGRKRDTYVHPSLKIPARALESGRENMTIMNLTPEFSKKMAYGVHAMCFDEDVGRLVVATKADRKLHVFDFAYTRERDDEDALLANAMEVALDYEMGLAC